MNILITGCCGQLGNELRIVAKNYPQHTYFYTDKVVPNDYSSQSYILDICNEEAINDFVRLRNIEVIINCAAYTNVDKAEQDADTAYQINSQAVEYLAKTPSRIIHISSDYVFSGDQCTPYTETDEANPQTIYGKSKFDGEQKLLRNSENAVIIRTSWLYSSYGSNFIKTMMRLGKEKDDIDVVFDQVGSPTYARHLAQFIFTVLEKNERIGGIYHYTNEGVCSWYDLAVEIFRKLHLTCHVTPILSHDYPYKTPRPHYSVLDKSKSRTSFNIDIPHWIDGLEECLIEIQNVSL